MGASVDYSLPTSLPEGKDMGSSLSVVFNPELTHILGGLSFEDEVVKCPCGKVDSRDITPDVAGDPARNEKEIFRRCGLRELGAETDEAILQNIAFYDEIMEPRRWTKRTANGALPLAQFHYLCILEKPMDFPWRPTESREMDVPTWWTPYDFLRLDETRRFVQKGTPGGGKRNPFHQLVVCGAIEYLAKKLGEAHAVQTLLASLERIPITSSHAVRLENYPSVLRELIRNREI